MTKPTKIDWRSRINPAHIKFNSKDDKLAKEIETLYGAAPKDLVYSEVIKNRSVDDKHILILLAGFQEVAEERGFESSIPVSISGDSQLVACAWQIKWTPDDEHPTGWTTGGTADATYENTGGWGYLGAMAGNRAFARAVKAGLGIRVYGWDEIGKKGESNVEAGPTTLASSVSEPGKPHPTLIRVCAEHNFSFVAIKNSAVKRWKDEEAEVAKNPTYKRSFVSDPNGWTDFESIAPLDCSTLISRIKEHAASDKAKQAAKTAKK